jgi:hypothetical protein
MVFFCGHFYESGNVLEHGLVLGRGDMDPATDTHNEDGDWQQGKNRAFTTSDFFNITTAAADAPNAPPRTTPPSNINASHVSLVACASARQAIQLEGDEPLGVVTALLYAGATSVTGTMWPTEVGAGLEFSRRFYEEFKKAQTTRNKMSKDGQGDDGKGNGNGMDIDLAVVLQTTVRKMKRCEETSRPYSWAGFVLHGTFCL